MLLSCCNDIKFTIKIFFCIASKSYNKKYFEHYIISYLNIININDITNCKIKLFNTFNNNFYQYGYQKIFPPLTRKIWGIYYLSFSQKIELLFSF